MTGESYNRSPVGRLVVRGEPLISAEKTLGEPAAAGMLVTCDGNDYKAKKHVAGTKPVGWIGYEDTDCKIRPTSYDTPFRSGDTVTVISGGQFELYAIATGPATIASGDLLTSNGDGTLKLADADEYAVAIACESVTVTASATGRVHVKTMI